MDDRCCCACGGAWGFRRLDGLRVCTACGLGRLEPFPSTEAIRALYGKDYYDAWGMEGKTAREAVGAMKRATFRRRLEELPRPRDRMSLLDVGCATGFLLEAARDLGYDPFGVEISAFAAREASRAFPGRIVQGTLEEAAFPDGRFDVVVLSDLLEHVPDPSAFLSEVRRVTRPGGRLLVVTPDFGGFAARGMKARWFHRKQEHLYYFTRLSLTRLLIRAGFRARRAFAASKALSPGYLESQLRAYPQPLLTPILSGLVRLLPDAVSRTRLWLPTGEMVVHAERPA